jgi:hypothetical protein
MPDPELFVDDVDPYARDEAMVMGLLVCALMDAHETIVELNDLLVEVEIDDACSGADASDMIH